MAVDQDDFGLPSPPPPRPARRESAIEAALRKFDGVEGAVAERPRRTWARAHRTQLSVAFSALLLVVIGIPAALIGLPPPAPAPPPASAPLARRDAAPPAPQAPATAEPAQSPIAPVSVDGRAQLRRNRGADPDDGLSRERVADVAAPAMAAAPVAPAPLPPPPPPPPPPPAPAQSVASAERDAAASDELVVTGSRVREPGVSAFERRPARKSNRAAASGFSVAGKPASLEQSHAAFLSRLQAAVRADQRPAIIALIAFPLTVNGAGRPKTYRDRASVERDFDRIFTPRVKRAILAQEADQLLVRDQGAMIGEGEVWFDRSCATVACSPPGPVRIRAVNP
jgi:hypothetical protein